MSLYWASINSLVQWDKFLEILLVLTKISPIWDDWTKCQSHALYWHTCVVISAVDNVGWCRRISLQIVLLCNWWQYFLVTIEHLETNSFVMDFSHVRYLLQLFIITRVLMTQRKIYQLVWYTSNFNSIF